MCISFGSAFVISTLFSLQLHAQSCESILIKGPPATFNEPAVTNPGIFDYTKAAAQLIILDTRGIKAVRDRAQRARDFEARRNAFFRDLRRRTALIEQHIRRTSSEMKRLIGESRTAALTAHFNSVMQSTLAEMAAAEQPEAALERGLSGLEEIRRSIEIFRSEIRERQMRELRFDVRNPETAKQILDSYLSVTESLAPELAASMNSEVKVNENALLEHLKKSRQARVFLYREMQFLRRLQSSQNESLGLRIANTLLAMKMQGEGRNSFDRLWLARENLQKLLQVQGLRIQRENLIAELLHSDELFAQVVGANTSIQWPVIPKTPAEPSPRPPNMPSLSFTASSRVNIPAVMEAYRTEVFRWSASWSTYRNELEKYAAELKQYQEAYQNAELASQNQTAHLRNLEDVLTRRYPGLTLRSETLARPTSAVNAGSIEELPEAISLNEVAIAEAWALSTLSEMDRLNQERASAQWQAEAHLQELSRISAAMNLVSANASAVNAAAFTSILNAESAAMSAYHSN